MPYKCEKIKLSEKQDRRRKLTEQQKQEIRETYSEGICGQRPLAEKYGVSRTTIQIIVNPERAEKVKNRIKEHWQDYKASNEERAEIMREHRHYKQELYKKGELT